MLKVKSSTPQVQVKPLLGTVKSGASSTVSPRHPARSQETADGCTDPHTITHAPPPVHGGRQPTSIVMAIQPWNLVFLVGFIAYLIIRGVFAQRTKSNEKLLSRAGAGDRTLIFIMFVGALLLPVVYLATPWLAFADYRLPAFAPWCGVALMVAALWLFWRSHADLGQNWSVTLELRNGHQVVRHGVYRRMRHPMYASIWLFGLAQGLLLENWLAGWSALVAFAPMYFVRVPREEHMMCEFFGQEYRDYMRQTGRLFPALRVKNDA